MIFIGIEVVCVCGYLRGERKWEGKEGEGREEGRGLRDEKMEQERKE